jgi:hypothetical protein
MSYIPKKKINYIIPNKIRLGKVKKILKNLSILALLITKVECN